ncbi:hypothetical protein CRUP_029928 [Coryphaenoides rupestris]|nr:hypothetical protein CRUP_029928 [Coryphaenoides rupestris]
MEGSSATGGGFLSRMALNDNKAGMEGLDRDRINKIIMEASKGSRFYEYEAKKEQQVNQRIEKMMLQKAQITEQQLQKAQIQVEQTMGEMDTGRDLSRVIVHVDMDAFYAAIREIFAEYDPHYQPMSLDEAYLDFTEHLEQRISWPESLRTHRLRAHTAAETGSACLQDTRIILPICLRNTTTTTIITCPTYGMATYCIWSS